MSGANTIIDAHRDNFLVVGQSHFNDMVWDLTSLLNNKRSGVYSMGRLNFHLLEDKPMIIEPIKRYFYIRLAQVKPLTVANEYASLASKLVAFLNIEGLHTLEQFNTQRFMAFNLWLKKHYYTNERLANNMSRISNTLLNIISVGQSMGFSHLPKTPIVLETSLWEWWGANKQGRQTRQKGPEDHGIPMSLWQQIIRAAWDEPDISQHIYGGKSAGLFRVNNAKFGILIQALTGLRISEVLYLKCGCVEKDNKGKYWLNAQVEKTEDEPAHHQILIPQSLYDLILRLEVLTQPLREEAQEKTYLFYLLSHKHATGASDQARQRYKPVPMESGKWNAQFLRPFLKRNNLPFTFQNSKNKTVTLSSHCFRHTFAKIAVADNGVNLSVLQTHFKHLSIEMTAHYVNLTKEDLKRSYLEGMIEGNSLYAQGKEGEQFKQKINEVKTSHNINELLEELSKLFGINPLPFGLCLYDFKRGHCPNLGVQSCYLIGCGDFITNESFLPNFQHEASLLEKHIDHCNKNGQVVEVKKSLFHLNKIHTIVNFIQRKD
ncbi:MAG: site-specific integrase [Epsilonproteobacteria bacterium]|nr:site-specific integrase [Campylobacterota bacterium]